MKSRDTWVGLSLAVVASVGHAATNSAHAQDYDRVVATVQAFFDAMENRDTAAYLRIALPEARTLSVRYGDRTTLRWGDNTGLIGALAGEGPQWRERMWEPEVRVSDDIATLWTEYDFHVDGRFSHCGVDAFQLVRSGSEWKIVQITYTVIPDREVCAARGIEHR